MNPTFSQHFWILNSFSPPHTQYDNVLPRSLSVFEEIPVYRTCEHADVENHWCSCLQWIVLDEKEPRVQAAAGFFVDYLNNVTSQFQSLCAPLRLERITRAQQVRPKSALLHFKKSADTRGFVPDLSDNTKVLNEIFQLQLLVQPGGGMFEATVSHLVQEDRYRIKESEISRINMYGSQDRCIHDQQPQLRKYCYCRDWSRRKICSKWSVDGSSMKCVNSVFIGRFVLISNCWNATKRAKVFQSGPTKNCFQSFSAQFSMPISVNA